MRRLFGFVVASLILYAISHFVFVPWVGTPNYDARIQRSVADENAGLPKMLNEEIREDKIQYANHVVHIYDTIVSAGEVAPEQERQIESSMQESYCAGQPDTIGMYYRYNVALAYTVTSPDPILGDTHWDFEFTPQSCKH